MHVPLVPVHVPVMRNETQYILRYEGSNRSSTDSSRIIGGIFFVSKGIEIRKKERKKERKRKTWTITRDKIIISFCVKKLFLILVTLLSQ